MLNYTCAQLAMVYRHGKLAWIPIYDRGTALKISPIIVHFIPKGVGVIEHSKNKLRQIIQNVIMNRPIQPRMAERVTQRGHKESSANVAGSISTHFSQLFPHI